MSATAPGAEEPIRFGPLLRRHRLAAGLTQESLAERTGLGTRSIQHLEGGAHLPHRETVDRLVRALGLGDEDRSRFARVARPAPRRRAAADDPPGDQAGRGAPRHNVPAQMTSFVGRGRELTAARELLGSTRLLTVTGVGGSGKTRLAQRIATDVVGAYPDGAWFVDLAPIVDPAFVAAAVSGALGVVSQADQPVLTTLRLVLRDRRLLLLLDNCEHLVDACARLVEAVLTACPAVRVLATSREPLGIAGELSWELPPMETPPPDWRPAGDAALAALGQVEAVRLFVERARAVDPEFRLSHDSAPAVARICRLVDGIPLALELAAGRARVFSVERIAARLDESFGRPGDPFRLLTGGSRTALPRHQTLRALIDWSHDLLGDEERRLFRRLSVFVGGCSYEAIEGVCAGEGIETADVPDLLTRLVDCSLVVVERGDPERYRLLETLRRYGLDRLVEAGEVERLRDRHGEWFLRFAEQARPELFGPRQAAWLDRIERERGNLRSVRDRALERGSADLGLRLAGGLWRFFLVRDYVVEGQEWLARALAAPGADAPTAARADVLDGACELSFRHDRGLDVPRLAGECLTIRQSLDDRVGVAWALRQLAQRAVNEGDHATAEEVGREALALAREAGATWVVAQVLETLGQAALAGGDLPLAQRRLDASLSIFRDLGDRVAVAWALGIGLAWRSWEQGELEAARACLQEALAIARELRGTFMTMALLVGMGALARLTGDHAQSRALLGECLELARTSGDWRIGGAALLNTGLLARAEGDVRGGEALVKESLAVFRDLGVEEDAAAIVGLCGVLAIQRGSWRRGARLLGAVRPRHLRRTKVRLLFRDDPRADEECLAAARTALGERDFAAATAEGQVLTLPQAIDYALGDED
jgi:predicted ATPase/transcriptional regulator with XRE-family HTH domain